MPVAWKSCSRAGIRPARHVERHALVGPNQNYAGHLIQMRGERAARHADRMRETQIGVVEAGIEKREFVGERASGCLLRA